MLVILERVTRPIMSHETALKRIAENIAKDRNYEKYKFDIKQVLSGGANYTSYLYKIKISGHNRDDLHLFGKVAAFGEEMRKESSFEEVYHLEIYFYQTLCKVFKSLEEQHNVPDKHRLFMSNMYGFSKERMEEIIVLDDLVQMGYNSFDRLKPLGWKEMSRLVEELAKFHSLSFAYGNKYPEEFGETLKHMKMTAIMTENSQFFGIWTSMIRAAGDVLEGRNKEVFQKFIKEHEQEAFDQFVKTSKQPVFIHGDYRPSNLMYKEDNNGKIDVVLLDYQTMRSGCVVVDLMYLIFNSTDRKFRSQHYDQLIEHYYTQLREALQRLDVDPDLVYPREDYQQELKENTILGLSVAAFCLQIVTVEESDAPKVDGNLNMEHFVMKPSSLFKTRFTEIVEEYIEWGLL